MASSAEDAEIVGYAFETTDFEPQEIGYSAPIEVLVGIDLEGELAGIEILFYRESYKSIRGDFLNSERFPNQFAGKSVADGFRVGRDIDGVSRATISSWAVSRGIRNSAREVASAYLGEAAIFCQCERRRSGFIAACATLLGGANRRWAGKALACVARRWLADRVDCCVYGQRETRRNACRERRLFTRGTRG